MAGGVTGVQVRNGIVYINGVAVAKRIGYGNGSISVNNMGGSSINYGGTSFTNSFNSFIN
ncbi:hypothetical protein ANCCAN_24785 [Ancylostoma caninum]|uniref:Uncharacterized protein n=1 Tax=Ancylostoma caninum TaxID=29170 RepID=A0A368FBA6_ANCCA|nr:hypothetical protein ANCCAN_24785 [Ancylostoma caninum]